MCLGGAYRVIVSGGVMAAATDTPDSHAGNLAQFGILVVAQLMTPAALDEVQLIATVDVFDAGPIHANSLVRGLRCQGTSIVDERKDDRACVTADALRINLEVRGDGHEGTGEQGVRPQFRG